jgi:tetratricopeptide (TPR) repeat protein
LFLVIFQQSQGLAIMLSQHQRDRLSILKPGANRLWASLILVVSVAIQSPAWSQQKLTEAEVQSLLAQGKQLVVAGQMAQAYELLSPHEFQLAGDADYDYLYGTAAVDSGHPDLAIFALERVLDERPSFAGARIELARAYYEIGDNESARYQFDYLMGQNPPPNVRQAITSYLRAIDRLAGAYRSIHLPHFAAGFGWDSNPNASTTVEQFLGFILDGNNTEKESPMYHASLGDYYSRPLSTDAKLILTGAVSQRNYPDASFVDSTDIYANAAVEWNYGDTTITPTIGAAFNWLDGDSNLDRYIGDLAVTHSLNDNWKLIGGATAVAHRFTNELKIRDADIYNARGGFDYYFDPDSGGVVTFLAQVGTDETTEDDSPFDNDRWAVTLSGSRIVARGMLLAIDAGYKNTDYDGSTNFFGRDREDDMARGSLSLHVFDWPLRGWRTIGRVAYTDVDSNLDLYTYDRTEVGVTFHRAFD